jgi:ribose 5-phosphate isomerase B
MSDNIQPIAIGSDHAGYEFKSQLAAFLEEKGFQVKDMGVYENKSADYPDFAHPVAHAVEKREVSAGILCCGSGNGVAITANKHQGIRAALCWTPEIAKLSRLHNNANVLCLPARFVSIEEAREMVETFLNTDFEGGRHQTRVDKISC